MDNIALTPRAIALIRPLVDAGLLPATHPVSISCVSGYLDNLGKGASGAAVQNIGLMLNVETAAAVA